MSSSTAAPNSSSRARRAPTRFPRRSHGHPNVSVVELPFDPPRAPMTDVRLFRALADLVRFYRPELGEADWPRRRTAQRVLDFAGHPDGREAAVRLAAVQSAARRPGEGGGGAERDRAAHAGRAAAPGRGRGGRRRRRVADLSLQPRRRPSATCSRSTRALGLPSLMLVWSWDNLSSKAVLHEHPDHLLVWNELQVDEAERLQGFPRERVHATRGSELRRFLRRPRDRSSGPPAMARRSSTSGSSKNISREEPERGVPRVAGRRPGRARLGSYGTRRSSSGRTRAAAPGAAGGPSPPTSRSSEARSSRPPAWPARSPRVDAVVALNTSGELEAAIAGLPVVTFRAGAGAPGPGGLRAFRVPAGAERRLRDRLSRPRRARPQPRTRPARRARPRAPTCVRRELRPPSRASTGPSRRQWRTRFWSAPHGEDRDRARTEVLPPQHHFGARRAGRARPRARLRHVRAESVHQEAPLFAQRPCPRLDGRLPCPARRRPRRRTAADPRAPRRRTVRDARAAERPRQPRAGLSQAPGGVYARGNLARGRASQTGDVDQARPRRHSIRCSPRSTG